MFKEEALEVEIETNPRANVASVERSGRRITFLYADGGGGQVLFDSDDRVRAIKSSRTAPWDRVVPPPKTALALGEEPRLFWLDDTCDVGAASTHRGTKVTTATAFRKKWRNRFYLNEVFPTASSYDLRMAPCRDNELLCVAWCYDRWGPVGDCIEAARRRENEWQRYLRSLIMQPWRLEETHKTRTIFGLGGSSRGSYASVGGSSSTGSSSSSHRGSSSSSGGPSWGFGGGSGSTGTGSRGSGGGGGTSTTGAGSIKRR